MTINVNKKKVVPDLIFFTAQRSENIRFFFIVSGEISVYLVKIKEVSISSEMISYHFTSD